MVYRIIPVPDELYHYGVKGMHWGVRRYQNYDGTRIGTGGPVMRGPKANIHTGSSSLPKKLVGKDGSIAGVKPEQLVATAGSEKKKSGMFEPTIRQGKGKENTSPAQEIVKNTRDAARESQKVLDIAEKHDPKIKEQQAAHQEKAKKEVSQMSDRELRERINRIKMEREYSSLTTKEVESGYDKAKEVLEIVGDVAAVTLALVQIYMAVKKVKGN